jgi:hypothetical protein
MFSLVGLLWGSYLIIIKDPAWFLTYTIFLGWWMALFPAIEYYVIHKEYFKEIF